MCCEDVKIGKGSPPLQRAVSVTTNSVQLVGQSPNRLCVLIGPPIGADIFISFGTPALVASGITLRQTDRPLEYAVKIHGGLATCEILAITGAGTAIVPIVEAVTNADICK